MAKSDFTILCESNGFIHKKRCYFRCIGDGVYQTIRLNESCYIDPFSPYYSSTHRRSPMIIVGLYSIYAALPEHWFNPRFGAGLIDANNLIGKRDIPFWGFEHHFEIMKEHGVKFLNGIDTQQKMVEAIETISAVNLSLNREQNFCLPLIFCGKTEEAAQLIDSYLGNERFVRNCEEGDSVKQDYLNEWRALKAALQSETELRRQMKQNMLRNLGYSERYGLGLKEQFNPIV